MSFMLGSFAQGLFGGASSMFQLWNQYQDIQDRKAQIEGSEKAKAAYDAQYKADQGGSFTPIDTTESYQQPQQPSSAPEAPPTKPPKVEVAKTEPPSEYPLPGP